MSDFCDLTLVRHGETAYNAEGILQGQLDVPLNARGELQAAAVASHLQSLGTRFAAVYSSDLARAARTAEKIADAVLDERGPVRPDKRLREMGLGVFENRRKTELERDPEFQQCADARASCPATRPSRAAPDGVDVAVTAMLPATPT